MKKLFSISFAFLILLSGMHFSIATHICGGEIAAVKWSFTSEKATCGMEEDTYNKQASQSTIKSNCCRNQIAVYSVDKNYSPSTFQINEPVQRLLQVFDIPVSMSFRSISLFDQISSNVSPPGQFLVSAVSLTNICVFRI